MKIYFVYIIASGKNGTIYIGVTNNLAKRIWEHKNKIFEGFSSKYNVNKLGPVDVCHPAGSLLATPRDPPSFSINYFLFWKWIPRTRQGPRRGMTMHFFKRQHALVYFEDYSDINLAIKREKRMKEWTRQSKINLIEKNNPGWIDLYDNVHY